MFKVYVQSKPEKIKITNFHKKKLKELVIYKTNLSNQHRSPNRTGITS